MFPDLYVESVGEDNHFNSPKPKVEQVSSKNRFKKIGSDCLSQITSLFSAVMGKISSFIADFIWPISENQSKNLPSLKELVEGGKDLYEGQSKKEPLVIYPILDTPEILDKQVALFPAEYKQQFKSVQRMVQFLLAFSTCQSKVCSPSKALNCLKMTQYQLNQLTDPLDIFLPREIQYKLWAYEKRCLTIAEVATATVFLTFSNQSQAKKVNVCVQFIFLGAANFPEIQNYLPKIPLLISTFHSLEETISSIYSAAKDLIIRPVIKKGVMPIVTKKIVSATENVGASWILDQVGFILDESIESLENELKEIKAQNDAMTNPYTLTMTKKEEKDVPRASLTEKQRDELKAEFCRSQMRYNVGRETLTSYLEIKDRINNGVQKINDSVDAMNHSDSILASVTGLMIERHFSQPTMKVIERAFQITEDILTDLAMSFVTNQIKEVAWSYLIPNSKAPFIACGVTSVLGISMPLFKGIVLVANGGRAQSIGQLGARILGAAVAIHSGSFLLGNMLVYGCFLSKYAIKLRKKHFERIGMKDPLIELMDSVVQMSNKQFLEIGQSVKSEITNIQIRNDIEKLKQKQKIVKQNKEKRKIIKANRANSYSPKSYSQDESRYSMEEIFVPTMGSNGKMRYERKLKFKAKPQYVLRRPEVKMPQSNFGSFAKNKSSE